MPRSSDHTGAAERARAGLLSLERVTNRLLDLVGALNDVEVRQASLLPGWSRAHVITHLARNADALVNLLTWARTGVEHPMYTSRADRDADIQLGSGRPWRVLHEDLDAACTRFAVAAGNIAPSEWTTEVVEARNRIVPAHEIPWKRLREVWIHIVDLNHGIGFADIPADDLVELIEDAIHHYHGNPDVPTLRLDVELPDGTHRHWSLGAEAESTQDVGGKAGEILAWLTGRESGANPALPPWL